MHPRLHKYGANFGKFWPLLIAVLFFDIGRPSEQGGQEKPALVQPSASVQQSDSSAARIFLRNVEIQGRIEKPQTVFILPGKDPDVDAIQIDRSFFKEIFRIVEKDDLTRLRRKH
jgi:hypothetical protein